ncbi:MAG: CBS domain-containing protein [Solirubrobacterales bacterium]|nr:CBS domain-containing protein [Solirubrobacterales bacterium]
MPDEIISSIIRPVEPLHDSDPVGYAARRVVESGLPALPVVDGKGRYAGLFGEREYMRAVFPAYVGTLSSARMIRRSLDDTIEPRMSSQEDPIRTYLTTDPVLLEDDYSDAELAETFLHHRVVVVPVATEGEIHSVVTRNEFFLELYNRINDRTEDYGC